MKQGAVIRCPSCQSLKHTIKLSVFAAHGNGGSKAGDGSSSSDSGPMPGAGGGCCGGGCGCN
jgi:hypothetical protein